MELFILLLPALFALAAFVFPKNGVKSLGIISSLIVLFTVVSCAITYNNDGQIHYFINQPWLFGITLSFGYDGVSLVLLLLTAVLVPLILLANYNSELANNKLFTSMVFFMQFGLMGVFVSMDGLWFYAFWEITLIPIFLITWWFGEADRKPILIKFFIYTFVGSIAMLASLIGMKVYASSFQIEDLRALTFTAQSAFWLALGFFIAFAVKIPLFPFHSWQPDTYTKAPMAGTMLLSAIMLKMALYGIIRWVIPMFPEAMPTLQPIIITVAIISTVYASIVAIMQQDIKRVFAYASMSHAGLIAAALMTLGFDGVSGSMVQIVNHGIVSVGLFLAAEIIFRRVQSRDFSQLGGFAALAPRFGFWFAALGFAAISVPFSSGFIGEFLMFKDLVYYNLFIGVVGLTTIIFGCVYIIRAYQKSMFGPAATASFEDLHWSELATLAVIVVLTAILGVYPALLTDFVNPSIEQILSISSISGH